MVSQSRTQAKKVLLTRITRMWWELIVCTACYALEKNIILRKVLTVSWTLYLQQIYQSCSTHWRSTQTGCHEQRRTLIYVPIFVVIVRVEQIPHGLAVDMPCANPAPYAWSVHAQLSFI